jgi:N-dimethylarginine dimethylaminohydrolase
LDALTLAGQTAIHQLKDVEIIEVDLLEARDALACNLVSTGETIVMTDGAPKLAGELRRRGLKLSTLSNHELRKSGGGFRCSSLSLYS